MASKTIGLCIITDKVTQDLTIRLDALRPFVDKVYLQVNGGNHADYKWNDNFADARNDLLSQVATDYWLWLDADDTIQHPERIRDVVDHMEANKLDMVFADYIYSQSEDGIPTEVQRRERFIKTGTPGKWVGAVHETFIPDASVATENTELVTWVHDRKTHEQELASAKRNERILRNEIERTDDPRLYHYLGLCLGAQGRVAEAIPWFEKLVEAGGWDEERYRAHLQIASCYQQLKKYSEAANEYLKATMGLPDWPDAYYGLQQVYYEIDDHAKSISWYETASAKTRPETDSAYNPVVIQYQPLLLAGLSYLFIGQVTNAVKAAGALKRLAPDYGELAKLEPEIVRAYNEDKAIEAAKALIKYASKYDGSPEAVLQSLPPALRADIRLTTERRTLIPGKTWPKGSVVFYCGQSYEPWGPDTLDKGMGGSEEAVVYLSRELANVGQVVTVYNERNEEYKDAEVDYEHSRLHTPKNVWYRPWTEINPNDTFDTFISERDPTVLKDITARVKLCDLHDTIDPQIVYNNAPYVDKYMFKSQWHRNLYPELPDDKAVVVGNGILESYAKV